MQEPDLDEKSSLHRHTGPLWMKEGNSLNTSIYTLAVTVDLRKTILPIPLVAHTQPHTITEVSNFTDLFKQVGL